MIKILVSISFLSSLLFAGSPPLAPDLGLLLGGVASLAKPVFLIAGFVGFAFAIMRIINPSDGQSPPFMLLAMPIFMIGIGNNLDFIFKTAGIANTALVQTVSEPFQPGPLTAFDKLNNKLITLGETRDKLDSNINSINGNIKSNTSMISEKSIWLSKNSSVESKVKSLKLENLTRLKVNNKMLRAELIINIEKHKELSSKYNELNEYVSEVKDSKVILGNIPENILSVDESWLNYERLYEEIDKELAVKFSNKNMKVSLNQESGRVNGDNRLNKF